MKSMIKLYILLALSSCATSYQPHGFLGGFSETEYSPDTVRISFSGNGFTSATKVQDYALLRAADYTFSRRYRYFFILNGNGSSSNYRYQTTPGNIQFNPYDSTATFTNPTYTAVTKSGYSILIKLSNEFGDNAIDAAQIRYTLARSLGVSLENNDRSPNEAMFTPKKQALEDNSDQSESDYWSAK